MIRHTQLEPRFVKTIPRDLEPAVLYVSMEYGTAVHSCCCGCGNEVVTPLTPTDWTLTFDGEAVSLWPSIGNWNLPCKSHYVIKRSRVIEAGPWSRDRVEAAQKREKVEKAIFYGRHFDARQEANSAGLSTPPNKASEGFWVRLRRWLS
ncbi:DUF6527 family protein [Ralstonia sp. SM1864_UCD524_TZ4]|uniref:Uncharacterized protein n=1 Tax=Ralstonia solanacearum TaxID=305 RepID=A0A0S4W779_RALSL|nr:DUF6527 family protein [Ralstonia pseudosolanacearum]CUV26222.1 conserved protein of unknown function [Ralstonia solanacearum]CUV36822.1 conserved protein of unknown function [Ralstonia solanacearum]CUV42576.1 conserved protein of unknown function [Ralstonia solanacearum]CUV61912.1 conserved protein of unknown function [Ralstonia solanacearum]